MIRLRLEGSAHLAGVAGDPRAPLIHDTQSVAANLPIHGPGTQSRGPGSAAQEASDRRDLRVREA